MKKRQIILVIVFNVYTFIAFAQTPLPASKPVKTGNEWKMPTDAFTRSKAFSDSLKSTLSLDDATTKQVFNAYLGNTKSVDEIAVRYPKEEDRKVALQANRVQFDSKLKEILSSEQFANYNRRNPAGKEKK